jgi:hypothetical protein
MRILGLEDQRQIGGGVEAIPALPGSIVTRSLLMGSWLPWTYGIGAFAGGFVVGTYIYDNFGTEILDGIDAVVN